MCFSGIYRELFGDPLCFFLPILRPRMVLFRLLSPDEKDALAREEMSWGLR